MTGESFLQQTSTVDTHAIMNMNGFQEAIAYAAYVGAMSAISVLGSMNLDNKMEQIPTSPCEGDDHMARKKFTFTLPNGESAWATGNTINDAFPNAFRKYGALFSMPQPQQAASNITLREFIEQQYIPVYFSSLKPTTLGNYQLYLKLNIYPFLGDKRLDEITVTTIQDFYNWMANASKYGRKQDLNADTIKRVGGFLGKIFRVAVELDLIKSSPVKNALLKNPGKPAGHHTVLPPEEMVRIKKQLPTLRKERERLYLTLLVYTGMRPQEILGMRWEHIHLDLGYCRVACTVTYEGPKKATCINDSGKTLHALRTVPLPTPTVQILQKASCKEGYVISSKDGTAPVSYSTHQRDCEHAFEELGIKGDFSSYDFRTTYGTKLCEAGLTSKQVGDLMGHADTRMVETVYARSREEGILTQLDFLNQLNESYVN